MTLRWILGRWDVWIDCWTDSVRYNSGVQTSGSAARISQYRYFKNLVFFLDNCANDSFLYIYGIYLSTVISMLK
jgi:hypothetical protein